MSRWYHAPRAPRTFGQGAVARLPALDMFRDFVMIYVSLSPVAQSVERVAVNH